MEITGPNIQAMFTGFSTLFQKGYDLAQPETWWSKLASEAQSDADQETYAWMAMIPRMTQWIGERTFQALSTHDYTLKNQDWQEAIKVGRNRIEDDKFGIFGPAVEMLGHSARKWPDEMLWPIIFAAESQPCFDNQNFFDPAHPIDMFNPTLGTQPNLFTGRPLTIDNFAYVRQQMRLFKGENNRALGIKPSLLVVPPQLEQQAEQILLADLVAPATISGVSNVGSTTNMQKGKTELLVVEELGSVDAVGWYLLDTRKPIKPFLFQNRRPPVLIPRMDMGGDNLFLRREFEWGVDARGAAGFTLWFLAAKGRP